MAPPTDPVDRTYIIGISGNHYSGKTTLAASLIKDLGLAYDVDIYHLNQSSYICSPDQGPLLEPFNFTPTNEAEKKWRNGSDPTCVKYSFWNLIKNMCINGNGYGKAKLVSRGLKLHFDRIIIVEGPLLFHDYSPLDGMFDLKIFLDAGESEKAYGRRFGQPKYKKSSSKYWMSKVYFDKVMWPVQKSVHRIVLAGGGGVNVENQGRTKAQTFLWAKALVVKGIAEQQQWWGTA